jgi:esterase
MHRHEFFHDALMLSYLDAGGDAEPLIALHAHWMEGTTFAPLASVLAPDWRVIALDQRGHGHSGHAPSYTRDDYLGDLASLYSHLGLRKAVLLGNSLGGVNAYQFAARHPDRVRALIIEDIGAEVFTETTFSLAWQGVFKTREELEERIGPHMVPYLGGAFRQTPDGWRLAFDPREVFASQGFLNGDHWEDWLATDCPALLIRGVDSPVTTQEHMEEMAARRPCTRFATLNGGHVVHVDSPAEFTQMVRAFLRELPV